MLIQFKTRTSEELQLDIVCCLCFVNYLIDIITEVTNNCFTSTADQTEMSPDSWHMEAMSFTVHVDFIVFPYCTCFGNNLHLAMSILTSAT